MTEGVGAGQPGPIGEEAAKLFAAAQDWFHSTFGDPATGARIATGAPECTWCPLCQLIAVLRGQRPEITEKWAETQVALAGLLRVLADAAGTMTTPPDGAAGASRVQRIDLDDDAATGNQRDGGV
jgi:hypothetical protein